MGNVKISFAEAQGRIKDMNSVNNGPLGDHDLKNHEFYAAARIPSPSTSVLTSVPRSARSAKA